MAGLRENVLKIFEDHSEEEKKSSRVCQNCLMIMETKFLD